MTAGAGRGWLAIFGLALVTASFSVVQPTLLIFVPLALLLVALPPRRPFLVLLGAAVVALAIAGQGGADAFWYIERGWAFLLGAWFVIAVAAWPHATFLSRALGAIAASAASAAMVVLARSSGMQQLDFAVTRRLQAGAASLSALLQELPVSAGADGLLRRASLGAYQAAELPAAVYPALGGLASLAALAVAWWGFSRLAWGERAPLRPLREFRFDDHLVWLVIGGVLLWLLPLGAVAARAGVNVLLFMGGLYALRGLAVVVALAGSPGPLVAVLGALVLVILYPVLLIVGLTDTWLDLRGRRRTVAGPGV